MSSSNFGTPSALIRPFRPTGALPDEVSEFVGEVLWGTLFRGDSDPFSYVDILNDSTIAESDKWDCE